jgi:hypothetical protein
MHVPNTVQDELFSEQAAPKPGTTPSEVVKLSKVFLLIGGQPDAPRLRPLALKLAEWSMPGHDTVRYLAR